MARDCSSSGCLPHFALRAGFTLIELLVAMAIIALLLSLVTPRYFNTVGKAEEAVLKENLVLLRDAIDKYYADMGKYPGALEDLVVRRYLRRIPADPITQSTETWAIVAPADPSKGAVYDIRSGATGQARDGKPYDQL